MTALLYVGLATHALRAETKNGYVIVLSRMDSATDPEDGALIARIVGGDTAAFETLYDRHSKAAYGLAYRIVGDAAAAEDVVQDAFMTVWRQGATYGHERGTVRSWLLAIAHHRAIDYVRRRRDKDQQSIEDITLLPDAVDTWELARQNVEGEQVRAALERLPDEQRRSVTMAYFEGYTHGEIACRLGVPLGTVKGRLRIGLQKMRGYLYGHDAEEQG